MKTKIIFLFVFIFSASCFSVSSAEMNRNNRNAYGYNSYNKKKFEFAYIPNLTPRQKYKIEQICIDRDRKLKKIEDDRRITNKELIQLERRQGASRRQIEKLRNKLYNLDKEVSKAHYKTHEKIYSLLTVRQREVFLAHTSRR